MIETLWAYISPDDILKPITHTDGSFSTSKASCIAKKLVINIIDAHKELTHELKNHLDHN